jgi:transposase
MPTARKTPATPPQPPDPTAGLPPLPLNAAGIDVGRAAHSVAVPPERSPEPVRRLASVTAALHALADGLQAGHLATVGMESTGVSWIPRCQILAARGFAGHVVNARHATHVPGRTTARTDGQWRPKLHTFGLRNSSCRPTADIWG